MRWNRRKVLAGMAAGGAVAAMPSLANPAAQWVEALPVGNGRIGAMVHGGMAREVLPLNEDTLYAGGP